MVSISSFAATLAVAALVPLALWSSGFTVRADACSGKGANPEVYNFEVNGYPAKVIRDASAVLPPPGLFLEDVEVISRMLTRRFMNGSEINLSFNTMYIDLDGEGVLIDTGNGPGGDRDGMLLTHLEAEGIPRESIKHILITHGHGDHISGLLADAETMELAFPDATVYVSRIEYEYWTIDPVDSGTTTRTEEAQAAGIVNFRNIFEAVGDKLKTFELEEEPLPGFKPILTPHHTPGHVAFAVTDGDSGLLVTGDSVNHRILTIENPWVNTSNIDFSGTDGPMGRYTLLDMAVKERWQLFSYHSEFPGLMYIDNAGAQYLTFTSQYEGSPEAMAVCMNDAPSGGDYGNS